MVEEEPHGDPTVGRVGQRGEQRLGDVVPGADVELFWPISTALALVTLWGIWAAVDGVSSLAQAFSQGIAGLTRAALAVMGVLALLAAVFAIFHPVQAAVTLTWVLGIWLIARGLAELVLAFGETGTTPRWVLVLGAVVDFLLGVLFAANPGRGALGIAWVLGLVALVWGVAFLAVGLMLRKQSGQPSSPASDPATPV